MSAGMPAIDGELTSGEGLTMKNRQARWSRIAARAGVIAAMAFCGSSWSQSVDCLAATTPLNSIDMRVLVISADGNEAVLPAIKAALNYVGVPHDVMIARDQLLSAATLCNAADGLGHARYQAVVLTTGSLGFQNANGAFESALSFEEWSLLWQYEAKYRIRQATFYTVPGGWPDTYGLSAPTAVVDTSSSPIRATLTSSSPTGSGNPSGRQVFADLRATAPITITNAFAYLAAAPAATSNVTPLLIDSTGRPIASIYNYPDGRKNLALTVDGNEHLLHTLSLSYGIINWVTKGLYIGERKVYLSAQPDDVLIPDDMWDPVTLTDTTGKTYRITSTDYNRFITWQSNRNSRGPGRIIIDNPFNASGATDALAPSELFPATQDNLTPAIRRNSAAFSWLSHTFTHLNLDNPTTYNEVLDELTQNDTLARSLRLSNYQKDGLITPDVSGLNNPEALRAMRDFGVRYVVSNTSLHCGNRATTVPPMPCPGPNMGIYNDLQPEILMVPRYPANLFYNVCTPAEWVSEYNHIYRAFWGRDLTYQEVLGKESDVWLRYLLNFDMRPVMFHQPNMCAYNGGSRSLLGDLIDATVAKFSAISVLPPQSRQLREIGILMANRMKLAAALAPATGSALTGKIVPGTTTASIVLANPTPNPVTVPITGVNWIGAASRETYGGQATSRVAVSANGGTVTVPGVPAW